MQQPLPDDGYRTFIERFFDRIGPVASDIIVCIGFILFLWLMFWADSLFPGKELPAVVLIFGFVVIMVLIQGHFDHQHRTKV